MLVILGMPTLSSKTMASGSGSAIAMASEANKRQRRIHRDMLKERNELGNKMGERESLQAMREAFLFTLKGAGIKITEWFEKRSGKLTSFQNLDSP
jgi:hypothetical protein